jgi:ABC-2 type transport system ATP-binding protein
VHVLHHGKVIASGTPGQLKSRAGGEGTSLDDAFLALTGGSGAPEGVPS